MEWITDPQIWIALPHAAVARDRPRDRQRRLHRDPRRQAAGGAARQSAQASDCRSRMGIAIRLLLVDLLDHAPDDPALHRPRAGDLGARPDPDRRRPLPDRQGDVWRSTRARGRGAPRLRQGARPSFASVIVQILLLDIVFSLDSVITAVGMADKLRVMIAAVVVAVGVMLFFARPIGDFVRHASDDEDAGALVPDPDRRAARRARVSTSTSRRATSTSRWPSRSPSSC